MGYPAGSPSLKCASACPVVGVWLVGEFGSELHKDHLLAARNASSNPRRISFAKITEPLELPQLLSLQTDSFDWLVGNEAWKGVVKARTLLASAEASPKQS